MTIYQKAESKLSKIIGAYEQALLKYNDGDYKRAADILFDAIIPQEISDKYNWGVVYYHGEFDVKQDYAKARKWFMEVAEGEDAQAEAALGEMCLYGRGGKIDIEKALDYFLLARKHGNGQTAMFHQIFNIGIAYMYGENVDVDRDKAFAIFNDLVDNKYIGGYFGLGLCYYKGIGVEQDYDLAWKFFNRFDASQYINSFMPDDGYISIDANVNFYRGMICLKQVIADNSISDAEEYFHASSKHGNDDSLYFLGIMFLSGYGVKQDIEKAEEFLRQAADKGNDNAAELLHPSDRRKKLNDVFKNLIGIKDYVLPRKLYFYNSDCMN